MLVFGFGRRWIRSCGPRRASLFTAVGIGIYGVSISSRDSLASEEKKECEVLVVGGGIVGASAALHVAQAQRERGQDVSVTLLEGGFIGSGASGLSAGTIWCGGEAATPTLIDVLCAKTMQVLSQLQSLSDRNASPAKDDDTETHNEFEGGQENNKFDCELVKSGALSIATTPEEVRYLREAFKAQKGRGLDVQLLDGTSAVQAVEPRLSSRVLAAIHSPQSGHCNPGLSSIALADLAADLGAKIFEQERAIALYKANPKGGDSVGEGGLGEQEGKGPRYLVRTSTGASWLARHVVIATGHNTRWLARATEEEQENDYILNKFERSSNWEQVGIKVPVVGVKGQIWTTSPQPANTLAKVIFITESHLAWRNWSSRSCNENVKRVGNITSSSPSSSSSSSPSPSRGASKESSSGIASPPPPTIPEHCTHDEKGMRRVRHAYGRQRKDGTIIFGGDRVRCSHDLDFSTTTESTTANRRHVAEFAPEIASIPTEGEWAGIMPFSIDGNPLIGELSRISLPGLWITMGFGPHGIMEGPGAAAAVAEAIVSRRPLRPAALFEKVHPLRSSENNKYAVGVELLQGMGHSSSSSSSSSSETRLKSKNNRLQNNSKLKVKS
eukprot:jgi/Bigna1/75680/fgenesh1_pg.36_\